MKFDLNPYYFILVSFLEGTMGSTACTVVTRTSYIADVTFLRWTSLRIGVMESALAFGACVGYFLAGYWLQRVQCNFIPPLAFLVALNGLLALYVIFIIPESISRVERRKMLQRNPRARGLRSFIRGFKLFLGGLSLRPSWKLYVSTIAVNNVVIINVCGAKIINVYFLKALPFDFDPLQIGIIGSVWSASEGSANFLVMTVLVTLNVGDVWIMTLAVIAAIHCWGLLIKHGSFMQAKTII